MSRRLARACVRLAAILAPRDLRARWREEWLAEIDHSTPGHLLRRGIGAPLDALLLRWTTRVPGPGTRGGSALDVGSGGRVPWRLGQDLRHAGRLIRRRPGVAMLVVTTLAIGIAGATTTFSVADAILWHPLPFPHAERFVRVRIQTAPGSGVLSTPGGPLDAWGGRQVLDGLYPFGIDSGIVDTGNTLRAFTVGELSPGLLDALSVTPAWGRAFSPNEYRPGSGVILASADLWRQVQAAGHATLGASVLVEGVRQTIVGVMPDEFEFPVGQVGLWRPYVPLPTDTGVTALGSLKPSVTLGQAEAAARVASQAHTSGLVRKVIISPFVSVGSATSTAVYVLLGAVALLLLTAIANSANVLMAEAVRRDVELALRATLGASWWRIGRQLAVEALVLSTLATFVALLLSAWTLGLVVKSVPYLISFQALRPIALDGRALMCAAAAAAVAGLGATSFAILRVRRMDVHMALRGQTSGMPGHGRLNRVLTTTQMAITLALLACAGVLARGLFDLNRADPGFDPDHVVEVTVQLPTARLADDPKLRAALADVRAEAAQLPGVADATITNSIPPSLGSQPLADLEVAGGTAHPGGRPVWSGLVDEDFFSTIGMTVIAGRGIETRDRADTQPVVVVSRALADTLWPGSDPVGHQFRESTDGPWLTVVGIVSNVLNFDVDGSRGLLAFYTPRVQSPTWWFESVILRTRSFPDQVVPALRTLLRSRFPDAPMADALTARHELQTSNARGRFATGLMVAFAGVALVLAIIGVYGAFWFAVRQRTREIGVRLALGAAPRTMMGMVIGDSLRLVAIGVAAGIPLAFAATRALRSLLFDVSPSDPWTFGSATLVLAAAAIAATYLPARRASRIPPVDVLRQI
jgi:putative ABC transport system permease protein